MKRLIFIVCILFGGPLFAAAAACPANCHCLQPSFSVTYCIDPAKDPGNQDLLYHFHGSNNNAETWRDDFFYTGQLRRYWEKNKRQAPTVVSVSFDFSALVANDVLKEKIKNKWLLVERFSGSPFSGLLPYFTESLMKKIEAEIVHPIGRRMVLGESMGAINSLQLALKTDLFNKAAVICPPVSQEISPFMSWQEAEPIAKKSLAWDYYSHSPDEFQIIKRSLSAAQQLVQFFVPNLLAWQTADVFQLVKQSSTKTSFYITAGAYDSYLAYEGSEQLVEVLQQKNIPVEWRPQWGGHCAVDIPSLADFLIP